MMLSYEAICLAMLQAELSLAHSYALTAESSAVTDTRHEFFEKACQKIKIVRVFERDRLLRIPADTREAIAVLERRIADIDFLNGVSSRTDSDTKVIVQQGGARD